MRSRKIAGAVLAVLPLLVFMTAEEGGKTSAALDLLGKAVNFLILFGGLAFVLRKPLAAMLGKRTLEIGETIRTADESKSGALERHDESEARLAGLEAEVRRLRSEAESEALSERERIARLAGQESQRIHRFTEQEIDQQVKGGIRELTAYAAEKATSLARERIRKKLTPKDQAVLVDKSIERLSRLHEEPGPR
jgi:F0F1-type ATP synthase membrane subunit b/b'